MFSSQPLSLSLSVYINIKIMQPDAAPLAACRDKLHSSPHTTEADGGSG